MRAIRGAISLAADSVENVQRAVKELLEAIWSANNLTRDNVICIMFSSTADIKSYYPAKAAREQGFSFCALYSSLEPPIDEALPLCIRVMLLANGEAPAHHIYLGATKSLRGDISGLINIAVDGPAGSGKSTVCDIVADRLGILHLDTGAMYRAVALKCVLENADYADKDSVAHITEKLDLKISYVGGRQLTILDGVDVSEKIREPHISLLSSYVSSYSFVRAKMVNLQRDIAAETSCVLDGRDIGTNVLPHCEFKFFLTASSEIRAKRRYEQDREKGGSQTFEEVLKDINERDFKDKNRAVAPLKQAVDATIIDTSDMTALEVADIILGKVKEKI